MAKCRACLVKSENVVLFDEISILTFNILTNLAVREDDGLPQHFCSLCYNNIYSFGQFRERCISADAVLKSKISCEIEVKSENTYVTDIKIENEIFNDDNNLYCEEEYLEGEDESEIAIQIIKNEHETDKETKTNRRQKVCPKSKEINVEVKNNNCERETRKKTYNYGKKENKKEKKLQFGCGLCSKIFENKDKYEEHVLYHKKYNRCSLCFLNFKDWWQTLTHRAVHAEDGKCCFICKKKKKSIASLEYHYRKVHSGDENVQLECSICFKKFGDPRKLNKHHSRSHSNKKFICDYCQKVFSHRRSIEIHLKTHNNEKFARCKQCDYASTTLSNLQSHILRKHTAERVYCNLCSKWFKNQKSLDSHKCRGPLLKVCPVCGKKQKCLTSHMRTHSTVAKFKCNKCPAAYKSKTSLRDHLDKHAGTPRKQCEFCLKAFYSGAVLIKHRRIHTGIKPYVCHVCKKAFTGNNNLKVHMRIHGEDLIKKKIKEDVNQEEFHKNFC
ncbi:zinc finger protein 431-like isoform X1 [Colias croceus]|uniref:zinc finger protein 431-like isoform X1 n=1 Tax=Colias crocea TaxID=72248 RepID=UPI001E27F39F|nr:zinc finger protein 431-like isoform X1 [Colias croceus]